MKARMLVTCALGAACSAAWADDRKIEISATAGWTFSDGVKGDRAVFVPNAGTFDSAGPADSFAWGARLGYKPNANVEIGGLFEQQPTKLEISGTSSFFVADLKVRNYHGYFAYNFGESKTMQPYLLGGLGMTQYSSVSRTINNVQRNVGGSTKFSSTWAAGLKIFPGSVFGLRLEGRWTPTYIKSDAAGWWCDPYWGCYIVSSAQFSNQFQLNGGATLRF